MAYTIRTTAEDEKHIKEASLILKTNSVLKTLLTAVSLVKKHTEMLKARDEEIDEQSMRIGKILQVNDEITHDKEKLKKLLR